MPFCTRQINLRSLCSWCAKGTEESTLEFHDPKDLGLICLVRKETQNPFSDSFGFKNPILDFLKERTLRRLPIIRTNPKPGLKWIVTGSTTLSIRINLTLRMYVACRPHQTVFFHWSPKDPHSCPPTFTITQQNWRNGSTTNTLADIGVGMSTPSSNPYSTKLISDRNIFQDCVILSLGLWSPFEIRSEFVTVAYKPGSLLDDGARGKSGKERKEEGSSDSIPPSVT